LDVRSMRHTIHNAHAVDLSHFGQSFPNLAHPRARRAVRASSSVPSVVNCSSAGSTTSATVPRLDA
jgi:hypothetical protein